MPTLAGPLMTRPQRQIDRLDRAVHWPKRPGWTCAADGQDWPCEPLRADMVDRMSAQEIGVDMGGHYRFAAIELDMPPAEVHYRFFGWIRGAQPASSSGWHPPGGPW